jgi:hypothetical protein
MIARFRCIFGMGKICRPCLTAGLLIVLARAAGFAAALIAESSQVANNK